MEKIILRSRVLSYLYFVKAHFLHHTESNVAVDKQKITIVIPAIEKDANVLPSVIKYAKANLLQEVEEIIVVSPSGSNKIKQLVNKDPSVRLISDDKVCPITVKRVESYRPQGISRSGWIVQQLIKLAIHTSVKTRKYLVIDADTILSRKQSYIYHNKSVLLFSDEFHTPYRDHIRKVLGFYPRHKLSFVAHAMLFDVDIVASMLADIEAFTGKAWHDAIVDSLEENEVSSMSEYEMYAAYLLRKFSSRAVVKYWNNKSVSRSHFSKDEKNNFEDYTRYRSVSYHSYN